MGTIINIIVIINYCYIHTISYDYLSIIILNQL